MDTINRRPIRMHRTMHRRAEWTTPTTVVLRTRLVAMHPNKPPITHHLHHSLMLHQVLTDRLHLHQHTGLCINLPRPRRVLGMAMHHQILSRIDLSTSGMAIETRCPLIATHLLLHTRLYILLHLLWDMHRSHKLIWNRRHQLQTRSQGISCWKTHMITITAPCSRLSRMRHLPLHHISKQLKHEISRSNRSIPPVHSNMKKMSHHRRRSAWVVGLVP